MKTSIIKNRKKFFQGILAITFWVLIWHLLYIMVNQEILIVSPTAVLLRLSELAREAEFWQIILLSMCRIMCGFIFAVAVGIVLAFFSFKFKYFKLFISPVITTVKSTPVASFVVLALVFVKSFYLPTLISFLMVVPIIYGNILEGINSVDGDLIDLSRVFCFSKMTKLTKIYIPSLLPYFNSAVASGLGFAWKAGVAAEVIANTKISMGAQIYDSKIYLDTLNLFSWTLVIIVLSILLEKVVTSLLSHNAVKYKNVK